MTASTLTRIQIQIRRVKQVCVSTLTLICLAIWLLGQCQSAKKKKKYSASLAHSCFMVLVIVCWLFPGSSNSQRKKQRAIPTNDELLYDPDEDDRDQAWVDARRRRSAYMNMKLAHMHNQHYHIRITHANNYNYNNYKPNMNCYHLHPTNRYREDRRYQGTFGRNRVQSQALPTSDAVLNCPSCMTTLCMDCQRWDNEWNVDRSPSRPVNPSYCKLAVNITVCHETLN